MAWWQAMSPTYCVLTLEPSAIRLQSWHTNRKNWQTLTRSRGDPEELVTQQSYHLHPHKLKMAELEESGAQILH